jgi:hypothetical protein
MMSLINHQEAYRIKSLFIKLAHTHSLDHGYYEIFFHVESVPLDAADGGAWAKLLDLVDPLVRQELLVDDDHSPNLQLCRKSQGNGRFPESARKGQNSAPRVFKSLGSSCKGFWLSRRIS